MPFNNFWRTFFAIALTAAIFATIVAVLCFIHRRETRRAQQAEAQAQAPAPAPARNGIDLPVLSRNNDFRESDETLVTPARPLVPAFLRPPIPRAANRCPV
ncbi:hypothetical protein EPUS_00123 [Endocarpon pusillum Z07020]|uniref:Uncharacterized protein n=1 Tax=Endocarpon pusillum (strain Z07020 / HMAS-L-300199) TaxID=1263415 RepID=U1GTI5_ENDPU|nr:uncharacterized protein EPUS_00123 [Endocarpon pusillum Z07020]ERF75331.1 hypothetical protein EPUS_00123 [Endocarpon pusillum Z07020]